jgi:hypothetical protein
LSDAIFSNQNTNLGKFWCALQWNMLVYFIAIWFGLRPIGIFNLHLVYFVVIWYIVSHFGILNLKKSGNPGTHFFVFPEENTINVNSN